MPLPVRLEAQSANIFLSTTPDVYIRRWTIKHRKLSILRKEHHPLIKMLFFCLDTGVHFKCGYFIHTSEPKSQDLYYYSQPAPERSEYEAYSPCFSPDGKRLAFVVNPYLA